MSDPDASSGCVMQGEIHQHGSSLCASCAVCPGGVAFTTTWLSVAPFQRLLPPAAEAVALFSVIADLADKPPKAFLV